MSQNILLPGPHCSSPFAFRLLKSQLPCTLQISACTLVFLGKLLYSIDSVMCSFFVINAITRFIKLYSDCPLTCEFPSSRTLISQWVGIVSCLAQRRPSIYAEDGEREGRVGHQLWVSECFKDGCKRLLHQIKLIC